MSVPTLAAAALPVEAHLDAGWDRLDLGDLPGAVHAAQRAADLEPEAAQVRTLRGAIAAAAGDFDQALSHYRDAMDKAPASASPLLLAAELHLYSLDEPGPALNLASQACGLADSDEQIWDAVLLVAEAHLALGHRDRARTALTDMDAHRVDDPALACRIGHVWLDMDDHGRAAAFFARAARLNPQLADAHHGLGLAHDAAGDLQGRRQAWLQARKLDLEAPWPPWHIIDEHEFERLACSAFTELPRKAQELLAGVPIILCEYPSIELVASGHDPRAVAYFATDGSGLGVQHPYCAFLYQRNIENAAGDACDLKREIRLALWHETALLFGLDDEESAP
jgi:Flp pilus assembly protein TadD/predicted Zn-dependent protease with MMP-like domain